MERGNRTVSFCCLSYNHANYVTECLNSILTQDGVHSQIILLDDGSSDDTVQLAREWNHRNNVELLIVTQKNSGNIGRNFNRLIENSTGDYITFIAADDYYVGDTFKNKIDVLNSDDGISFVAHKYVNKVDDSGRLTGKDASNFTWPTSDLSTRDLLELEFENIGSFYLQGTLLRRSIVTSVGGFDEDLIGDDINFRTKLLNHTLENGLKFELLETSGVFYRQHQHNLHKNRLRQIQTVMEWKERYFSERNYPRKFYNYAFDEVFDGITADDISQVNTGINTLYQAASEEDYSYISSKLRGVFSTTITQVLPFFLKIVRTGKRKRLVLQLFGKDIYVLEKDPVRKKVVIAKVL